MTKKSESILFREAVLAEIAKITESEGPQYLTSGVYNSGRSAVVNIKTADERTLRSITMDMITGKLADEHLGYDSKRNGFAISSWLKDTKTRADVLRQNTKLKELRAVEAETSGILTDGELKGIKFGSLQDKLAALKS